MTTYPTPIRTQGVKYLGSKRALLPALERVFQRLSPQTALDVFTGTTRVAQMLRWMGVKVTTSDVAEYSRVFSRAWVSGTYDMRYLEYVAGRLDRKLGYDGWFTRTYCDVPGRRGGIVRFMSPENGRRVDVIRDTIDELRVANDITDDEAATLVATLILAMDKVDNTVGVQQAYLKDWCVRSKRRMSMQTYNQPPGPVGSHIVGDVLEMKLPSADVAYIDPPYNQHVYLTNYHIWESIARWDKPDVDLKTNRRVDLCQGKARTPWNTKAEAPGAFRKLLGTLDVGTVVISYATGSHIGLAELADIVSETHDVKSIEEITVAENIMSVIGNGDVGQKKSNRIEWIVQATPRS